jgi:hypothetical protein
MVGCPREEDRLEVWGVRSRVLAALCLLLLAACSYGESNVAVKTDAAAEVASQDSGFDLPLPQLDRTCSHCHNVNELSTVHPGEGLGPRDLTGLYGDGLVRADAAFPTAGTVFRYVWPERGRHGEKQLEPDGCGLCHPVDEDGIGHGVRQYPPAVQDLAFAPGGKSCASQCHSWLPADALVGGFERADGSVSMYEGTLRPGELLIAVDNAHSRLWKEGSRPEHAPTKIASFNPGCGGCHNAQTEAHGNVPTCLDCHKMSGDLGEPFHTIAILDIEMFGPELAPAMSQHSSCGWCHPGDDAPPTLSNAACYNCHLSAHQIMDETGQPHFWHLHSGTLEDPAACGIAEYQWLPTEEVGQVVTWQETLLSNVDAEVIDQMLKDFGYTKLSPTPYGARTFNLRYVTQDKGKTVEATAVVGVPVGADLSKPLPIVAYLHPTVGFTDPCSPSADPLLGPGQPLVIASQGFIGVSADLLGLVGFGEPSPDGTLHPYLVAEPTAIAMLDAVRATLAALEADPDLAQGDPDQVVVWGASQGGHGAFMTELYAPHYAPEFHIVAVAAAIAGTDLIAQAEDAMKELSPTTGALAAVLVAMADWYGFSGELAEIFTDEEPMFLASSMKEAMLAECAPGDLFDPVDSVADIYLPDFISKARAGQWDQLYPWGCYLEQSSVGRSTVPRISDTPILSMYGELDELSQPEAELASMKRLCDMGYRIEYHVCAGLGHVPAGAAAFIHMFSWTKDRLAGNPWPTAAICTDSAPIDCEVD